MEPLEDPGTGTALSSDFAAGLTIDAMAAYRLASEAVATSDSVDRLHRSESLALAPLAAEILHWMRLERERQRERDQPRYDVSIQARPCSGAGPRPKPSNLEELLGEQIDQAQALEAAREKYRELRAERAGVATGQDLNALACEALAFAREREEQMKAEESNEE